MSIVMEKWLMFEKMCAYFKDDMKSINILCGEGRRVV
jgi:hypothetical protein